MYVIGNCFGCGKTFTFNPYKVPSIRYEGTKREVCATCIAIANLKRVANGLDPIEISPGAYEPIDEFSEGEGPEDVIRNLIVNNNDNDEEEKG